ncbi:hypothetical protein B0J13DRAFT_526425 [Dactylonectria estremocensis]|uniref:Azaphilone pigments biosynthesis cluster protein L N-terminal domain-containing protein n=1 Tax=Dactylonectria estremocensis TaxID=1079267 RepID=A0A9P9EP18_9HYPO|nr:hypothetical protein B0J13DRAFT_526425 [Dactylonectria estremocensis]
MDPLSISTNALSLAAVVFKTSVTLRDMFDDYSDAPQAISDVSDEDKVMQAALRVVESAIRAEPHAIARFDLEDMFSLAVKGCHTTLLYVRKQYEQLFGREDWKAKIMVLWKNHEMTSFGTRLDRKKSTIGILVQTLNL